ncbi:unnamed protein product [Bemisia tabaci]|uniref:Uncharacterized protein n=2 Tax=Bemisia tabaci TaxID=7038 RepID=A0A9P0ACL8_BEMTA|nr:unnamed protein product [Bemisia tabaci]
MSGTSRIELTDENATRGMQLSTTTVAAICTQLDADMSGRRSSSGSLHSENNDYLVSVLDRPPPYAPTTDAKVSLDDNSHIPSAPSYGFAPDSNMESKATGQYYNERLNNTVTAPGAEPPPPYDSHNKAKGSGNKQEKSCARRTATYAGAALALFGFLMCICLVAFFPMTMGFDNTFEESHDKAAKMFAIFGLGMVCCVFGCIIAACGSGTRYPTRRIIIVRGDDDSV